jgi:hypothetical protein
LARALLFAATPMARRLVLAFVVGIVAAGAWHVTSSRRTASPRAAVASAAAEVPDEVVDAPGLCEAVCGSGCARSGSATPLHCPRRCDHDGECGGRGAACSWSRLNAAGERVRRCLTSECGRVGSDVECGPGRVCLEVAGGLLRCNAAGVRRAGERCREDDDGAAVSCGVGLRCADGRCAAVR